MRRRTSGCSRHAPRAAEPRAVSPLMGLTKAQDSTIKEK
jgi:hypothetical protein